MTTLFDIESGNLFEKGIDKQKGTLMIYNGERETRGTVCASNFDYRMADILCTELGYKYGNEWGRSRDIIIDENIYQQ